MEYRHIIISLFDCFAKIKSSDKSVYQQMAEQVHVCLAYVDEMSISREMLTVLKVKIRCEHDLQIIALERSNRNLYDAVLRGIPIKLKNVDMTSRLPLSIDGALFSPDSLTASISAICLSY